MRKYFFTFRNSFSSGQIAIDAEDDKQAKELLRDALIAVMAVQVPSPVSIDTDMSFVNLVGSAPEKAPDKRSTLRCLVCMREAQRGSNYCGFHNPLMDRDRDDRPPQPWRRFA